MRDHRGDNALGLEVMSIDSLEHRFDRSIPQPADIEELVKCDIERNTEDWGTRGNPVSGRNPEFRDLPKVRTFAKDCGNVASLWFDPYFVTGRQSEVVALPFQRGGGDQAFVADVVVQFHNSRQDDAMPDELFGISVSAQ